MGQFLQDYGLGRRRPQLLAKKSYMLRQRPSPIRGGVRPYFLTVRAFIHHGRPCSTCSTVPGSPYPRWELSIVPPRPTIYSNRVGMNSDLPLTRLPVHNPSDCFHSVSVLHATSLIFYAT